MPHAYLALILGLALLLFSAPARSASEGQKWALVVGIDRYDQSDITPLRHAGADARAVAGVLVETAGFQADHIVLMTSDSTDRQRPTSTNVLRWLEGFKATIKPGDSFVFYFSGHGMVDDDQSYLLTAESSIGTKTLLQKSSLGVYEIKAAMQQLRASRLLQVMDACRNDPKSGRATGDNRMRQDFARDLAVVRTVSSASGMDVMATLFACKIGQRSYEAEGNGYFTSHLIKGLRGAAVDPAGVVTLPSLVSFLERAVPEAVRLHEPGKTQQPWAEVSGSGAISWVLARPPASLAFAPAPVDAGPAAAAPAPPAGGGREIGPAPVLAVAFPPAAYNTASPKVKMRASVQAKNLSEVMVTVNGERVALDASSMKTSGNVSQIELAVPLQVGENSVVITALGEDGEPAQTALMVTRADMPAVAAVAPPPVAFDVNVTPAIKFYAGELRRVRPQTKYEQDQARYGRQGADFLNPTGGNR